ncbi:Late transcription factor VLTF-4 (1), partial [Monkeypox virus]|jgi:hypothetical protein
MAW